MFTLCSKCSASGTAHVVGSKEVTAMLAHTAGRGSANMGHTKAMLKSDNGPAMKALASRVKDMKSHPTIVAESPEYEPQASGVAEGGAQPIKGLFMTMRSALGYRVGEKTPNDHVISMWLVRHAASLLTEEWPASDPNGPLRIRRAGRSCDRNSAKKERKWPVGVWQGLVTRPQEVYLGRKERRA